MKIQLEGSFYYLWDNGYVRQDKSGRRRLDLVSSSKERTTISYARYLWLINYGDIPEGYEVDHIDDDCSNDSLDNLQLLSKSDNAKKSSPSQTFLNKTCPICDKEFTTRKGLDKTICCSRSCGCKLGRLKQLGRWGD